MEENPEGEVFGAAKGGRTIQTDSFSSARMNKTAQSAF